MRALSLTQPWASLVAAGVKRIETRSWQVHHRGWVAIHATKVPEKVTAPLQHVCDAHLGAVGACPSSPLPLGCVVAIAYLAECVSTNDRARVPERGSTEFICGDYSRDRFMFFLSRVIPLPEPVPARGMLGLWEWEAPADLLALTDGDCDVPRVPLAGRVCSLSLFDAE